MRIGVMLRHYDQHGGGVKVYTERLLRALLDLGSEHQFVFLYRNPSLVGTYAKEAAVEEVALPELRIDDLLRRRIQRALPAESRCLRVVSLRFPRHASIARSVCSITPLCAPL